MTDGPTDGQEIVGAFVGSLTYPKDNTGIDEKPVDFGKELEFSKFSRFYAKKLAEGDYQLTLTTQMERFICVQFHRNRAIFYMLFSKLKEPKNVFKFGTKANEKDVITVNHTKDSSKNYPIEGEDEQVVWFNANPVPLDKKVTFKVIKVGRRQIAEQATSPSSETLQEQKTGID